LWLILLHQAKLSSFHSMFLSYIENEMRCFTAFSVICLSWENVSKNNSSLSFVSQVVCVVCRQYWWYQPIHSVVRLSVSGIFYDVKDCRSQFIVLFIFSIITLTKQSTHHSPTIQQTKYEITISCFLSVIPPNKGTPILTFISNIRHTKYYSTNNVSVFQLLLNCYILIWNSS